MTDSIICVMQNTSAPHVVYPTIDENEFDVVDLRGARDAANRMAYRLEQYTHDGADDPDKPYCFIVTRGFMSKGRYTARLQRVAFTISATRWHDDEFPNTYTIYRGFN